MTQQQYDPSEAFVAGVAVVRHTISDKIIQICNRAIAFLTNLCSQLDPELTEGQRRELGSHTEFIMNSLIEKLGENLAKVRQASEEAVLAMCNHHAFGPKLCVTAIVRHTGSSSVTKSVGSQ